VAGEPITIYHNPRCSNSRGALAILEESGQRFRVVEYVKTPLDANMLRALMDMLESPPHEMVRAKEPGYRERGLSKDSSPEELVSAMAAEPQLMQRPIVVQGDRAVIARPPEMLRAWLRG